MAVSDNHFLLEMHGDRVLGPGSRWRDDPASAQLVLWAIGNSRAAGYGAELRDNYIRLRYEDLCSRPADAIEELIRFLGASVDRRELAGAIRPSGTIGRWRALSRPDLEDPDPALREALHRFGYR